MVYVLFGKNNECCPWNFKVRTNEPELIKQHIQDHPEVDDWLLIKGEELEIHIEKKIDKISFDESD